MNSTQLLRTLSREQTAAADAEYQKLVRDSVAGVESEPLDTIQLLERVGKTVDDFEVDCAAHEERVGRIASVAALVGLKQQLATLQSEIDGEWKAEQQRREEYTRKIQPRLQQRDLLQAEVTSAEHDRWWLVSHPTKAIVEAKAANGRKRAAVNRQLEETNEALRQVRVGLVTATRNRESAERNYKSSPSDHHRAELAQYRTSEQRMKERGEALELQRDAIQTQVDALGKELDSILQSEWAAS
jgi:chromosome segregation ATPase